MGASWELVKGRQGDRRLQRGRRQRPCSLTPHPVVRRLGFSGVGCQDRLKRAAICLPSNSSSGCRRLMTVFGRRAGSKPRSVAFAVTVTPLSLLGDSELLGL